MPIKAKYNGSYKDITDLMNVDESIDYVLAKTSSSYKRVYTATRSIEDAPPTTFKSIKPGANLTDYRIYGNTSKNILPLSKTPKTETIGDILCEYDGKGTFTFTSNVDNPTYTQDQWFWVPFEEDFYFPVGISDGGHGCIQLNNDFATGYGVTPYFVGFANRDNGEFVSGFNVAGTALNVVDTNYYTEDLEGLPANCIAFQYLQQIGKRTVTIKPALYLDIRTQQPFEPYGESVGDRTANLAPNLGRWIDGYLKQSDGTLMNATSAKEKTSPFIEVNSNDKFTFSYDIGSNAKWAAVAFYDENKNFISRSVQYTVIPFTFIVNIENAKFIRLSCNTFDSEIYPNLNSGSTALPYEPYGYKVPVTTDCSMPHTATLQLHDCLPSTMQFDAPEALYYAENGLTAGTYNFTIQDRYDTSYGGGKTYQFTLANDVPAKGQLVFGWSYKTQASAAKITSYASPTSTTAIEQVGVTEGSGGTSLGTTDGNSTNVNHIHRARYSSNNYKKSAIRQFLNSSAVAGSVWTPQTKYDRPPSWNASTAGFMKDIDSDFLAVLGASPKVVALNPVTDGCGSVTINNDKFFLLSRSEVYGGKENNINEGEPYPYYSNYSDLSAAGVGEDSNRIKYRSGTAQIWWLRSPDSAFGRNVRYVGTSGHVGNYLTASYSHGVAPACNIALDEDYKFNGQVLHVRDQISVTKGNQTLVFDVIGIDHDEVHFDKTTTNIYLPEQIRKVGDEAEYIDYAEQKMHRVRKNLLPNTATSRTKDGVTFTVNSDGSVTCNTDENGATETTYLVICKTPDIPESTNLILSGCPKGGSVSTYALQYSTWVDAAYTDTGNGKNFTKYDYETYPTTRAAIRIYKGCVCNNLTFYPMIRKADIEDDTYEPYIENTEVDVTLPALPTLPGTNVLSVGTEVQPSKIDITGHIKTISGGS